jgi:hypothetical protein
VVAAIAATLVLALLAASIQVPSIMTASAQANSQLN